MNNKKHGFTLAEVLITLGIIGVVAALTMPSLIANYQKQVYTAGLKKAYTVINNGFQLMIVNKGCGGNTDALLCTGLFGDGDEYTSDAWINQIDEELRKVFNIVQVCKGSDTSCSIKYRHVGGTPLNDPWFNKGYNFITSDGFIMHIHAGKCTDYPNSASAKLKSICAWVSVDTNGKKKPNQYGRDFFEFVLGQNGYLYPAVGMDYAQAVDGENWKSSSNYWKNNPSQCGSEGQPVTSTTGGSNCAARIMENGWVMDY